MIEITVQSRPVLDALQSLQSKGANLGPALREIGEDLQDSTLLRFVSGTGPDGQRWPSNTRATYEAYLRKMSGTYHPQTGQRTGVKKGWLRKDGKLGAKGVSAMAGKKPLIGESRALSTSITYYVDRNTLVIGSPMEYAAMQQFGGRKAEFPFLWGDIPARPFLGISTQDETAILAVLRRHFGG